MADKVRRADRAPRVVPISVLARRSRAVSMPSTARSSTISTAPPCRCLRWSARCACRAVTTPRTSAPPMRQPAMPGFARGAIAEAITRFPALPIGRNGRHPRRCALYQRQQSDQRRCGGTRALVCYPAIHLILGGVAKSGGIDLLAAHFRVRGAY